MLLTASGKSSSIFLTPYCSYDVFSNHSSSLRWCLLFRGTDDGVIRIYKGYDEYDKPDAGLVTAWRALKGMEKSSNKQSGLVCDWYQNRGHLLIGGDARVIKVWDAQQELVVTVSIYCLSKEVAVAIEYTHTIW
jgi:WD40 repeat protein